MNNLPRARFPMMPLKRLVSLCRSRPDEAVGVPYVGLEDIESSTGRLANDPRSSATSKNSYEAMGNGFDTGDVLFGKLRPYLAKTWIAEFSGVATTEALVMRPHSMDARFLKFVCLSSPFLGAVDASTFGSKMPRAEWDFIGAMPIPRPRQTEQVAIVRFLERETGRLDALIAAKNSLLRLLAEKRRSLVALSVTQSIDSQTWRERPVKYAYSITLGKMLQDSPRSPEDVEVHYLKAQHVQWSGVKLVDLPTMWASPYEVECLRVTEGDLLVCEGGEVGRAAIVDREPRHPTILQNALHLVRGRDDASTKFLMYCLHHAFDTKKIHAICNASTIAHFTTDRFGEMQIHLPDTATQAASVQSLDCQTGQLDELMVKAVNTIQLLKERRAALISAAVVGEVDVRSTSSVAQ